MTFILFSGGLDTKWESIRPIIRNGMALATLGVLLTAALVGLFATYVLDFSLYEGLLLGAIVSSTDAAAVFSILRSKNFGLKGAIRPTHLSLKRFYALENSPRRIALLLDLAWCRALDAV